jgi:hypothetical protein
MKISGPILSMIALLVMISIYTVLIMVIWNNVLVKKLKGSDLQHLSFLDSLSIAVFFAVMSGFTHVINQSQLLKNPYML